MKKEKISVSIGNNKALTFYVDAENKEDQEFAKRCKEVEKTNPQSLQDFFTRLNKVQQKKANQTIKNTGRKM
ncbi:hypothetical protein [Elizabethkingia occulta]|uniref:hypothetical protein n=1 Tax=Elizabethkingia occulta TaxID=1867263 RepID=UPI00398C2770